MRDASLQRAVRTEHDESLAIRIEPTCRIDIGNRHDIGKGRPSAARGAELAEHAVRLVEQDDRRVRHGIPLDRIAAARPRRAVAGFTEFDDN